MDQLRIHPYNPCSAPSTLYRAAATLYSFPRVQFEIAASSPSSVPVSTYIIHVVQVIFRASLDDLSQKCYYYYQQSKNIWIYSYLYFKAFLRYTLRRIKKNKNIYNEKIDFRSATQYLKYLSYRAFNWRKRKYPTFFKFLDGAKFK